MGKPVLGDSKIDAKGRALANTIEITVTYRTCLNYDQKVAKRLRKVMAKAIAELDDVIITKIQQDIGD